MSELTIEEARERHQNSGGFACSDLTDDVTECLAVLAAEGAKTLSERIEELEHEAADAVHQLGSIRATLLVNFGKPGNRYGFYVDDDGTTEGLMALILGKLTESRVPAASEAVEPKGLIPTSPRPEQIVVRCGDEVHWAEQRGDGSIRFSCWAVWRSEYDVKCSGWEIVRLVPAAVPKPTRQAFADVPLWAQETAYRIVTEFMWGWEENASDELTADQSRHVEDVAKFLSDCDPRDSGAPGECPGSEASARDRDTALAALRESQAECKRLQDERDEAMRLFKLADEENSRLRKESAHLCGNTPGVFPMIEAPPFRIEETPDVGREGINGMDD